MTRSDITMENSAALRKINQIPASLESIRREVMTVIQMVQRETNTFLDRYMTDVGSPGRWMKPIRAMCERLDKDPEALEDYKDLHQLIQRYRTQVDSSPLADIGQLRRMVERARMFEYIAYSLRNELVNVYENKLRKYCLSFIGEANGQDLQSVKDYENKINSWKQDIRTKFDRVDGLLDEVDSYRDSLERYIGHYERVLRLMEDSCRAIVAVTEPMRKWCVADAAYPRHVQEEINIYNRRKMDLRDVSKQLEYDRDQLIIKLRRRDLYHGKLERVIYELRDEKRSYKRRQIELTDHIDKITAEMARKQRDLDDVKSRFQNRKSNSPAIYNYLSSLMETLRQDIWDLERKTDTLNRQANALKDKQAAIQREIDAFQTQLDDSNAAKDRMLEKLKKQDEAIRLIREDANSLDDKIRALKLIREIKLHSSTVKKIYHFGYTPGRIDYKDELDTAFEITARDVGKDWVWLYRQLPFKPPRDPLVRNLDIEAIDRNLKRAPKGNSITSLALKSLEKWRRLSTVASLPELLSVLKKMKKKDTVRKIKSQMRALST